MKAHTRRSLILVTKVLQNLSNNVLFGGKEEYMVPFNDIIVKNRDKMHAFLEQIAKATSHGSYYAPRAKRDRGEPIMPEVKNAALARILAILILRKEGALCHLRESNTVCSLTSSSRAAAAAAAAGDAVTHLWLLLLLTYSPTFATRY